MYGARGWVAASSIVWLIAAGGVSESADLELAYTMDVLHNTQGGVDVGTEVLGMADAIVDAEFLGEGGIAAHLHLQYTHGGGFSAQRAGDLQTVSNIDAPNGARVLEAWLERSISEHATLKAGLYDLNSEFDALDTGELFIGSSHGVGPDFSQSGANGPSIFPTTSLALRGQWRSSAGLTLQGAVLDAVPGDPEDPGRTAIILGDGALFVLESQLERSTSRMGLGMWRYSRPVPLHGANDAVRDHEQGVYAFLEGAPWCSLDRKLRAFARIGWANPEVEQIGAYVGAGLVLEGALLPQLDNSLGFAVASARTAPAWRDTQARIGDPAAPHETTFELTWRVSVGEHLVLQPDLQYIVNPGASAVLPDALIAGVRLIATLD